MFSNTHNNSHATPWDRYRRHRQHRLEKQLKHANKHHNRTASGTHSIGAVSNKSEDDSSMSSARRGDDTIGLPRRSMSVGVVPSGGAGPPPTPRTNEWNWARFRGKKKQAASPPPIEEKKTPRKFTQHHFFAGESYLYLILFLLGTIASASDWALECVRVSNLAYLQSPVCPVVCVVFFNVGHFNLGHWSCELACS